LLVTGPNGAALSYDPLMRLHQTSGAGFSTKTFAYDGNDLIAEYTAFDVQVLWKVRHGRPSSSNGWIAARVTVRLVGALYELDVGPVAL
jgi:hypothetical protein